MEFINKIKVFFSRLFNSNNGPEVQPITIFDASTIRRIENDDRCTNPDRINSSFDLMNFDRIRSLERRLDETNQKVDQTTQKVNEIEIKIDKNTEDINRLTGMIETLAINIQNHEEKMAKYDKMLEKLDQSLADNKIRINKQNQMLGKQDHWMKKYAKDVFKNKNKKPERNSDSRTNSSFVSCTSENSGRPRPDMEYSHDSAMYDYDNGM